MHLIVVIQSDSVLMSLLSSVEYVFLLSQSLQAQAFCSVLLTFKIGTETLGIGWGGDCFTKCLLVVKIVQCHSEFKAGEASLVGVSVCVFASPHGARVAWLVKEWTPEPMPTSGAF